MKRSKISSTRTISASWWSRTATRNCARCCCSKPAVPKDKLRSVLIYGGFPLSANHVVDVE